MSPTLKLVACPGCKAHTFLPAETPPLTTITCKKCGTQVMMPLRLKQFEIRKLIGTGGMGTVYQAWDFTLEREVAIKLIKPEMNTKENKSAFLSEARACASLNHTNIIHIYTCEEFDALDFIVMELAAEGSLDQAIEKFGHLNELPVLDIGIKIASALDLASKKDLLHSDIKPGNILFNADKEPKLVDFGLAHKVGATTESADHTTGTPYYVAPEKIKREQETILSDMYSLAATLYHALTGYVPFDGPTVEAIVEAHVRTPLTPPNLVRPEISQYTSDALEKALAKEPAQRFLSYDAFIMALEEARSRLLSTQNLA